jgi:hypothetical protein
MKGYCSECERWTHLNDLGMCSKCIDEIREGRWYQQEGEDEDLRQEWEALGFHIINVRTLEV